MIRKLARTAFGVFGALVLGGIFAAGTAQATTSDYSFTGTFGHDSDVQLFNFTVGSQSQVILRTWSYAGGVNAAGDTIARGGFDPILALFDGTGKYIDQNDDGGCSYVAADALTGACWDTYFSALLDPGNYTVAVMEYNNFANGPYLSNGFARQGDGNFTSGWSNCGATSFCDVSNRGAASARGNFWAFDILNVDAATQQPPITSVPEPAPLGLLGFGVLLCGWLAWRRRHFAG
ncbi:MAG TPA: DVUA0089 family protein [Rhodanobacteraceae bacterium]|nr:DVUA0089 family protein [Rhodanobacteraceae bacterium]